MNAKRATRTSFALAAALSAAIGLSACGSSDVDTAKAADNSSSSTVAVPKPAAVVPAVSGGSTAVALDAGFTGALTQLGLTPGTIGGAGPGATRAVTLPVHGSAYRPWVQGVLSHQGSGLSLPAGGPTVSLPDFPVAPGKPARLF